ncbi:hypothetical protein BSL82_01385 [Tardibacter chloracetimidivorans]|uniref:Anti-sigma factor n=1 Tax=Tardibacter chloracetimidivorans TaxID=1921510 RepID=A0A1L3ZR57_9SPHN|nr:hypothetical protein [Tardibacter chloracetimidivorans]API58117.1 hypothetical protein BSL82_01385 [Tardibacter chloracetimidivorans]
MAQPNNPVSEVDLCAYVDGQLDIARRIEVEDYLARHPDAAAALMADLKSSDAMRLALGDRPAPRADIVERAVQLDRRLAAQRIRRLMPRLSFAALATLCLWLAQDEIGEALVSTSQAAVPPFANEAIQTHNTARLRDTMTSQVKTTVIDATAIREATRIVFPRPSDDWRIMDTRLVPSDDGTGLEISLQTGLGVPLTFFAVPTRSSAPSLPDAIELSGASVAYWRKGNIGYALAGSITPVELDRLAEDFADNPID